MRILLASSEVHPYSKTGGLADMVGALAKSLAAKGHRIGVVTPLYQGIRERFPQVRSLGWVLPIPLGPEVVLGEVWALEAREGLTLYFVHQPKFFLRDGLYVTAGTEYTDNAERFIFLSKATAELARQLAWAPEVVHVHDWQVGLAPLLIHHQKRQGEWSSPPATCLTVHNLAYQGIFPPTQYPLTNLPWDYFHPEAVEYYDQLNCLKAGLVYSDRIITVSPRYAREVTTEAFGCGLDGVLRRRQDALIGILNGVDYEEWRTNGNPHLRYSYSIRDRSGKTAEKLDLQQECALPVNASIPLFGIIARLTEQKGVDILIPALQTMLQNPIQLILLGTGEPQYEKACHLLRETFPQQVWIRIGYDQSLAHRIEAASDFFLMPSRFEPCGLNQMYSLRYGTIPIVRATGGLDDSVIDINESLELANGIKFHEYSARALAKAMRKAVALYSEPELLRHYRDNAMRADFSWERTSNDYLEVYRQLQGSPHHASAVSGPPPDSSDAAP